MIKRQDAHYRSIIKALTWRIIATTSTMVIVYFFTGKVKLSLGIGAVEVASKFILYYLHERAWQRIPIGMRSLKRA